MKLIVITSPNEVEREVEKITALFEEGLELLHVRKPELDSTSFENLLKTIPSKYVKKIVIHSHFKLIEKYNLKGVHLTGTYKSQVGEDSLAELFKTAKKRRISISTSFHSLEELLVNKWKYDYVFLSPIFDSISKRDYPSSFTMLELKEALECYNGYSEIIALGGIDENNLSVVVEMGFFGAAFLGAIWNGEDVVRKFRFIKKISEV